MCRSHLLFTLVFITSKLFFAMDNQKEQHLIAFTSSMFKQDVADDLDAIYKSKWEVGTNINPESDLVCFYKTIATSGIHSLIQKKERRDKAQSFFATSQSKKTVQDAFFILQLLKQRRNQKRSVSVIYEDSEYWLQYKKANAYEVQKLLIHNIAGLKLHKNQTIADIFKLNKELKLNQNDKEIYMAAIIAICAANQLHFNLDDVSYQAAKKPKKIWLKHKKKLEKIWLEHKHKLAIANTP